MPYLKVWVAVALRGQTEKGVRDSEGCRNVLYIDLHGVGTWVYAYVKIHRVDT